MGPSSHAGGTTTVRPTHIEMPLRPSSHALVPPPVPAHSAPGGGTPTSPELSGGTPESPSPSPGGMRGLDTTPLSSESPTSPGGTPVWPDPISPGSRYYPMRSVLYPPKRRPSNLGTAPTALISPPLPLTVPEGTDNGASPTLVAVVPTEKGKGEETLESLDAGEEPYVLTARFEHAATADGDFILTGRDGNLQKCEDEPIRCPGAIQAFGVLIAFDVQPNGHLKVQQVSENSGRIISLRPSELLSSSSFLSFLPPSSAEVLVETIAALLERDADPGNTDDAGPMNFSLWGYASPAVEGQDDEDRDGWEAHAAIHCPSLANPNRIVLELELVDDQFNPLSTITPNFAAEFNEKFGMASSSVNIPTAAELSESTESPVKPLRALTKMKGRKGKAALDVVTLLSQINEQLSKANDLTAFLKITAALFKELTGFDRAMVYQFDESWNGRVVAEQVDWSRTKDLFRGLNFPASDIPAQARELYKLNKVRQLYDRDQPTARLCCRSLDEVETPLDMTHCHLRAMSPIHVVYLRNMGVRSSMSVSLTAFGKLWGLVALHTYGDHGHRVAFPLRQLCRLLGESVSTNIERLSYFKRLNARRLINTNPTSENPSGFIVAKAEDLLALFDADFGILSIGDEAKILGTVENSQELLAILEFLRTNCFTGMRASVDIRKDFDIEYPAQFEHVAGLLSVPLSSEGKDFICFCRKGQLTEVKWAGNPYTNKQENTGKGRINQVLEPRKSFQSWTETVVGKCRGWTEEELETAGVLCLVYGKFIDVWRQKETALAANQLTNLLLANASHEVRTPLNAIINYLELALELPVEGEVREHLAQSHAASRSLIHVINDLLDLTRIEKGNDLSLQDPFELSSTIEDAIVVHRAEATRRGILLDVLESPSGTPQIVLGDRAKIRTIVGNLVANAVKHTEAGSILVEWGELVDTGVVGALDLRQDSIRIGISITDPGSGISEEKLENIFREFEEVSSTGPMGESSPPTSSIGLGLAVVARIVRNLDGQLRVESKVGHGSKFTLIIPFRLPTLEPPSRGNSISPIEGALSTNSSHTVSAGGSGVVTKIMGAKRSNDSRPSVGSSNAPSEIDQLITAMSTSHLDPTTAKSNSTRRRTVGSRRPSLSSTGSSTLAKAKAKAYQQSITTPIDSDAPNDDSSSAANSTSSDSEGDSPLPPPPAPTSPKTPSAQPPLSSPEYINSLPIAITPLASPSDERKYQGFPGFEATPVPIIAKVVRPTGPLRHASEYRAAAEVPDEARLPPLRVLVVEDEAINRTIIEKRLKKDGHAVVVAEHGGVALRLLEVDDSFDVVLMDLQMPILNGYEAALGIRALPPAVNPRPSGILNGRVPIIAVSASLHERQRSSLVESGFDAWILKPVDFKRLNELMRGAIDRDVRTDMVYRPGAWEKGGWLVRPPNARSPSKGRPAP